MRLFSGSGVCSENVEVCSGRRPYRGLQGKMCNVQCAIGHCAMFNVHCAIEQCAMCNGSLCIIPRSILSPRSNLGLERDGANNAPPGETISHDPVLKLVEVNLEL